MAKKYLSDPVKCMVCATVSIFMIGMCFVMYQLGRMVSLAIFAVISLLYGFNALRFGTIVEIGPDAVIATKYLFKKKVLKWSDISQVGVCSTTVFRAKKNPKGSSLYIFFSEQPIESEKDLFGMILRWPPKKLIYMQYTQKRIYHVQLCWNKKIALYNTGDFTISEQKKN